MQDWVYTNDNETARLGVMITTGDLIQFYDTPLGKHTRQCLRTRLDSISETTDLSADETHLYLGYGFPLLPNAPKSPSKNTARIICALPIGFGATPRLPLAQSLDIIMIDDHILPFPDQSIDLLVAAHILEFSHHAPQLLEEIWRVLKPNGRVQFVIPNRKGMWTRALHTPWGQGQPYSRSQIRSLLTHARLSVTHFSGTLALPPWGAHFWAPYAAPVERIASAILPDRMHGTLVVEAIKNMYSGILIPNNPRLKRAKRKLAPSVHAHTES